MKPIRKLPLLIAATVCAAFLTACGGGAGAPANDKDGAFGSEAGKLGGLTETISGNVTAAEYFFNKGLSAGWNLGNTLDSSATSETAWNSNHTVNQNIFNGVKGAGFNVVRVPITWGNNTGTYTARLNRVAEVAAMAHKAGLVTIINVHHDASPETANVGPWLLVSNAGRDAQTRTTITNQYKTLWTQIANKFKDYGEWLIFESINEPKSTGNDLWESAPTTEPDAYAIINEWNQAFTDVVRGTGGNNAKRLLMYNGYAAKPSRTYGAEFKLPTDSAQNRQLVSFHYYVPNGFSLEGTDRWWDPEFDDDMELAFRRMRERFGDMPVVIGECGATFQGARTGEDKKTADESRIAYHGYLGEKAKEYNMVPVLWDNGSFSSSRNRENFGLFNRATGSINGSASELNCVLCIDALVKGVKR